VSVGQIVVLNGAPRSGKSSIVAVIQETFGGVWINLGVDVARATTPARYQPGIGLRPGEPHHPAAPVVPVLYGALYDSIAAHSRLGLNVAVDVGHYDRDILADCARRLAGLTVLFVGVHCPVEVVMERRGAAGDPPPEPVLRWQREVHAHWDYDLELDTSVLPPEQCAAAIRDCLLAGPATPAAFERLQQPVSDTA
jgi:chloramphenicol 3-O phosphotransferase